METRVEADARAARFLHERFGDIGLGEADPAPTLQLGYDDTLNVTLMFGGEPRIRGGVSWVETGQLDIQRIDGLAAPDVANTRPHARFLEQFDEGVKRFGADAIRPPRPHGVLEQALDLCGDAFLVELIERPARAGRLLDVLADTVIRVKEFWDLKCFGEVRPGLSLGGCSTTMLSPQVVAAALVPRYARIAGRFGEAFICACGPATQHLENWARVPDARYVRCGWGTDLVRAARILGDRHINASLSVTRAAGLSADAFADDVHSVLDALADVDHVSLLLINAAQDTPDENVRRLVETARSFAGSRSIVGP